MDKPIIFFDGTCGLCDYFINFVITRDTKHRFFIATLQGVTAKDKLPSMYSKNLQTVVVLDEGRIRTHSDAVIFVLRKLGGIYSFCALFLIIPSFVRDRIYLQISKKRYKFFGKSDVCRLPSVEERKYFLD